MRYQNKAVIASLILGLLATKPSLAAAHSANTTNNLYVTNVTVCSGCKIIAPPRATQKAFNNKLLPPPAPTSTTPSQSVTTKASYVAPIVKMYFPKSGTKNKADKVQDKPITLVGLEIGHYVAKNTFVLAQLAGSMGGIGAGYKEGFVGLGHRFILNSKLDLMTKLLVGTSIHNDQGAGEKLLLNPELGLSYQLNSNLAAELDGGYLIAAHSSWRNTVVNLQLNYYFNQLITESNASPNTDPDNWRLELSNETYFDPKLANGGTGETMQLVNIQLDRLFSRYFYATGQAAFAYAGQGNSSYITGMLGIGLQTPVHVNFLDLYSEILVGASGDDGLAVGSGGVIKPLVGIRYQVTPYVSFHLSGGKVFTFNGKLNSYVLDGGIGLTFGHAWRNLN